MKPKNSYSFVLKSFLTRSKAMIGDNRIIHFSSFGEAEGSYTHHLCPVLYQKYERPECCEGRSKAAYAGSMII